MKGANYDYNFAPFYFYEVKSLYLTGSLPAGWRLYPKLRKYHG
ncbi:hypothetical protein VIBNIPon4_460046 [Vibrio nigripulchritudo POn4]|nr:hypothetical protein VIBNIFTn2_410045 [Vibrio nigripulchritudo FTn2]CCN47883.1 hypothetical protein VIBNIMADA3020_520058 [Vibrio nigripulchritudo MADA3020]CCN65856.1 hypothetical protein VIBNIPon4_460046 [Vibrio nigripulchritudo POn4]